MIPTGAHPLWPRIRLPASRRNDFTRAEWKAIKRAEHRIRQDGLVCDRCGGEHEASSCVLAPVVQQEHWGTKRWRELHKWGLAFNGTVREGRTWLARWLKRVRGCGGCRKHAIRWVIKNPPDWSDPFAWTVTMHNVVNRHLKRAELTVEEARAIWSAQKEARQDP